MLNKIFYFLTGAALFFSCSKAPEPFIPPDQVVALNQIIYKDSIAIWLNKVQPGYALVWEPDAVNGNFAVVFKNLNSEQYCIVVRGSLIELSKDAMQNWVQDFNIFNLKKWDFTDTVKKAYISNGSYEGFKNLLLLKDKNTKDSLQGFLKKLPSRASVVISGHSLGGNLAQVLASYIWNHSGRERKKQLHIISFGATVVGNNFFVQDLEEKYPKGLRYEIEKDIAPKFPSVEQLAGISEFVGLDSFLGTNRLAGEKNLISKGIGLLSDLTKSLKIIPEENNYTQSKKHLQLLESPVTDSFSSKNSQISGILEKIYHYHKIDQYAEKLGAKVFPVTY